MTRRLVFPLFALVALAAALAFTSRPASADPRDFTLHNISNVTIAHLYVQPTGPDDDWGDDILGQDVLLPGESAFIYFTRFTPDNCFYDIMVVDADGGSAELLGVDLCDTTDVTYG